MSELNEALTAANASALSQKRIDPLLLEYVRRYNPFMAACPSVDWDTTSYYYNQRTVIPRGGNVTDGGARAVTTSTYVQNHTDIKLYQNVGAVTGYSEAVTRNLVGSLLAKEQQGAALGQAWDIENGCLWGNNAATLNGVQPMHDGLDSLVSTYSGSTQNSIDEAEGVMTLSMFDNLIDLVEENVAMPVDASPWMFLVSPKANSKFASLFTNQQRFMNEVEVATGLNVPSYRGVPIVKSSFLSARSQTVGTVTASASGSGGSLATATYYYRVSYIIERFGETAASTEISQAVTGPTGSVTLTVPAYSAGPDGAQPILMKVFRSTTTNAEVLIGITDAFDTTGAAVTSIIDIGTNLQTNSAGNTGPAAYVNPSTGQKPRNTNDEDAYLVPRNPDFMVRPYVRSLKPVPLAATTSSPDTLPFAIVSDTCLAIRGPKYLGRLSRLVATL